jgi:hypothetical protein
MRLLSYNDGLVYSIYLPKEHHYRLSRTMDGNVRGANAGTQAARGWRGRGISGAMQGI